MVATRDDGSSPFLGKSHPLAVASGNLLAMDSCGTVPIDRFLNEDFPDGNVPYCSI